MKTPYYVHCGKIFTIHSSMYISDGRLLTSFPDFKEEAIVFRQYFSEKSWSVLLRTEDVVESASSDDQIKKVGL